MEHAVSTKAAAKVKAAKGKKHQQQQQDAAAPSAAQGHSCARRCFIGTSGGVIARLWGKYI